MTDAMFLVLLVPLVVFVLIILAVDIATVLRGGYSMFTPPWVVRIDIAAKASEAYWRAVDAKKDKELTDD
jgi:hypothetical protein